MATSAQSTIGDSSEGAGKTVRVSSVETLRVLSETHGRSALCSRMGSGLSLSRPSRNAGAPVTGNPCSIRKPLTAHDPSPWPRKNNTRVTVSQTVTLRANNPHAPFVPAPTGTRARDKRPSLPHSACTSTRSHVGLVSRCHCRWGP